jgi:CO dehydrogenase maturation factor
MNHLVLVRDDIVIMDMEAGVEHLGRATSASVDALIVIVNPGARSRTAAVKIKKLGQDIGIKNILILGNRVKGAEDEQLIRETLPDFEIIGFLHEQSEIIEADRAGRRAFEDISDAPKELYDVVAKLSAMK